MPIIASVCMITYNQEKYVSQAIESIVCQETNFKFELVIGDDGSTDKTKEICIHYAKKFKEIKFLDFRENIGAIKNFFRTVKFCSGDFIALCEGDDYWISKNKLMQQVEFLRRNKEYSMCYHRVYELTGDQLTLELLNWKNYDYTYDIRDLAKTNFIHTVSVIYRNNFLKKLPDWFHECPVGDYPLHIINAKMGKIKYFHEPLAVYRRHSESMWHPLSDCDRIKKWLVVLKYLSYEMSYEEHVKKNYLKHLLRTVKKLEIEYYLGNISYEEFHGEVFQLKKEIPGFSNVFSDRNYKKYYFLKNKACLFYKFIRKNIVKMFMFTRRITV